MPRRSFFAEAAYAGEKSEWVLAGALTGIGGTLMTLGAVMFFVVILGTIFLGRKGEEPKDIPVSETLTDPAPSGWELKLDNFWLWVVVAIVLIVMAYGPFFLTYLPPDLVSPGIPALIGR